MGLDISFNKAQAVQAGLVLRVERNGDAQQVAQAEAEERNGDGQPGYAAWLDTEIQIMEVPGADHSVHAHDGWTEVDGEEVDILFVRANRWGSTFLPLTTWLDDNGIDWSES